MIDVVEPYITHKFNGIDTLSFDISPYSEHYKDMAEESTLFYEGAFYTVKKIDERQDITSVECDLNLDDLKANCFNYETTEKTLSYVLGQLILYATGWTCTNASAITISRSIELSENVNILDVLSMCADIYGCQFQFDNVSKTIDVIKYEINEATGTYFTDELNLKDISFKGDSTDFCTRLIGYGKKNEDTGEYLTFASLNGGKNYVENYDYSNKIITKAFVDERFTDAVSLRDEAIERLKLLAIPQRSYECSVVDLAKINPEFEDILNIAMYDIVTLIDRRRNTRINHRVMEYVEYPEKPENNVVTLSSVLSTITGTVSQINQIIENTGELKVNGVTLNEFKRDIDSNSLAITKCYTKGQTDTAIVTGITQSVADGGSINLYVSEQSKLKSTTYSLPPDTYMLNDTFCPDKDYFTETKTFKKGVNYIAVNSNDIPTQKLLMFSDGKLLKFSDEKYLVFPDVISDNWDKKDNYQTDKDVSASMTVKAGEIIQECRDGALSASTKFSADKGLEIFNGDFSIYDKVESDSTKKKVFGVDTDGNLGMLGYMGDMQSNVTSKTGRFEVKTTEGDYIAVDGLGLFYNGQIFGCLYYFNGQMLYKSYGSETQWFNDSGYLSIQSTGLGLNHNYGNLTIQSTGLGLNHNYGYLSIANNTTSLHLNSMASNKNVLYANSTNLYSDCTNARFLNLYANNVQVTSDRNLKKDIKQNTSYALDKLKGVNFYAYTLNKPIKDKDGNETGEFDNSYSTKIGLMYDEAPDEIRSEDENGEKHIDLYASISLAIKSIQELNKKVDRQALKISTLEIENTELKKQLAREKIERQIVTNKIKKGLINNG